MAFDSAAGSGAFDRIRRRRYDPETGVVTLVEPRA